MVQPPEVTIDQLYPHFSPEERELAAANLRRYVQVVARIVTRLEAAKSAAALGDLTLSPSESNILNERSAKTRINRS